MNLTDARHCLAATQIFCAVAVRDYANYCAIIRAFRSDLMALALTRGWNR